MLVYDPQGRAHNKEPVDVRECVELLGWTREPPAPEPAPVVPGHPDTEQPAEPAIAWDRVEAAELTVKELRDRLKDAGITPPHNASKAELLALYLTPAA